MPYKNKVAPAEKVIIPAGTDEVVCDGGGGPLGHPQVWYSFDGRLEADCFYCGRHFVKTEK